MRKLFSVPIGFLLVFSMILGCSGPEEKKMKFFDKGMVLFEQGEYTKAGLEFKNAVQIDLKFADAYTMLGKVAVAEKKWKAAFGNFQKAIELDPEQWAAHVEMGKIFLGSKVPEKAMEKADLVLEKDPANQEAQLLKGAVWVATKEFDKAAPHFEALYKKGIHTPDVILLLGTIYLNLGYADKAENVLEEGLTANPDSLPIRLALTERARARNDKERAIKLIEEAWKIDRDNPQIIFLLSGMYWEAERREEAAATLNGFLSSDSEDDKRYVGVAEFFVRHKQADKAESILKKGISVNPENIQLRLALSDFLLKVSKQPDEALDVLQECLHLGEKDDHPQVVLARNAMARIFLQKGDVDSAEEHVGLVLKNSPANVEAHFLKGSMLLERKDGVNAVPEFRTVVQENPQLILGHIGLSQAHVLNGENNLARDVLEKALLQHPESMELNMALARFHGSTGDLGQAQLFYQHLIESDPENTALRMELGDLLAASKEYQGAEEVYKGVLKDTRQAPVGYLKLSDLELKQGHAEKALEQLEKGAEELPESNLLAGALIRQYLKSGKMEEAEQFCRSRLKAKSDNPFIQNMLGEVLMARKDWPGAESAFRKTLHLEPKWPVPWNNLSRVLLLQEKKEKVIAVLNEAIRNNPGNHSAYNTLGQIYVLENRQEEAIRVYRQALEKNPNNWSAANDLAFLLGQRAVDEQGFNEALEWAEKAIKIKPHTGSVVDTLGWIHYRKGDFEEARTWLKKAQEKAPQVAIINYHLGMALHRLGQSDQARIYLEKSLQAEKSFDGREEAERVLKQITSA